MTKGIEDGLDMDQVEGGRSVDTGEGQQVGQGQQQALSEEEVAEASVKKLEEFMIRKGIPDIEGLVEYAAGLERTNTKMAQDLQRLMVTAAGVQQSQAKVVETDLDKLIPENPVDVITDKAKFKDMVQKLRESIWSEFEQARQQEKAATVQQRLQRIAEQDPDRFQELRPIMYELAAQNPSLTDVDELYKMADAKLKQKEQAMINRLKQSLGLSNIEPERIRGLANKARISGSGQPDAASKKHKEILDAIVNSDRY